MFLCSHYSVLHLLCGDSLLSLCSDLIWNKAIGSLPLKEEQFIWPFFKMVPADVTAENSTNRPRMWLFKLGQSSLRPFIKMAWKHLGLEAIERNSVMLVCKLLVLTLGLIRKKVIWSLKRKGREIVSVSFFFFFFFLTCQFSESQFLVYATFRCCEYHSISSVWGSFHFMNSESSVCTSGWYLYKSDSLNFVTMTYFSAMQRVNVCGDSCTL